MRQTVLIVLDDDPGATAELDALRRLDFGCESVVLLDPGAPGPATSARCTPGDDRSPGGHGNGRAAAVPGAPEDRLAHLAVDGGGGEPRRPQETLHGARSAAGTEPAARVRESAKRHGCGMIVMMAPRDAGPGTPGAGNLVHEIACDLPAPLLIVPRRPSGQAENRVRRILAPLDGSAAAEDALPLAVETADRLRAEVALVEVVDASLFSSPLGERLAPQLYDRLRAGLRDQASHYLRHVAEDWTRPGRVLTMTVLEGTRREVIARSAGATDLIVWAVSSRVRPARWLPEGVAETL
ncbi:MAG: universal stress protein, partial [Chloroflexota bacterium]